MKRMFSFEHDVRSYFSFKKREILSCVLASISWVMAAGLIVNAAIGVSK